VTRELFEQDDADEETTITRFPETQIDRSPSSALSATPNIILRVSTRVNDAQVGAAKRGGPRVGEIAALNGRTLALLSVLSLT